MSCHVSRPPAVRPARQHKQHERRLLATHSLPLSSDVWVTSSSAPLAFEASGRPVQKVFSLCAAVSDLVYIPDWRSAARAASVFFVGDERDTSAVGARRHVCKVGVTPAANDANRFKCALWRFGGRNFNHNINIFIDWCFLLALKDNTVSCCFTFFFFFFNMWRTLPSI